MNVDNSSYDFSLLPRTTTDQSNRLSSLSNKIFSERQNRNLIKLYAKPQLIQQCLITLDIFKDIIQNADQMKNRVIRDVIKNLTIQKYNQNEIIYNVQDMANQIFLVFQGEISLNIKKQIKQSEEGNKNKNKNSDNTKQKQIQQIKMQQYQQMDTYVKGQGFGQAQFIRGTKRDFQACVKQNDSIIGKLDISSFQQVVQNYKKRIYFKKLQMFKMCPILSSMTFNKLQFIVNNSKPVLLGMSKILVHEGQTPKYLYLVSKGQLQIFKNNQLTKLNFNNLSAFKSKKLSKYYNSSGQNKQKIQIRKLYQGSFIGDIEIALNDTFKYSVRASSQKVYLYACDIRLILNQITQEELQKSKIFYHYKQTYQNDQVLEIKITRKIVNQQSNNAYKAILTPEQIRIKKIIRKRYLDTRPFSLVDESSPLEIYKMIERKKKRLKTENFQEQNEDKVPKIQSFQPQKQRKKYKRQCNQNNNSEIKQKQLSPKLQRSLTGQLLSKRLFQSVKIKSQRFIQPQPCQSYFQASQFNLLTQPQQQQYKSSIGQKNSLKIYNLQLQKRKLTLPPIFVANNKIKIIIQEQKRKQQEKKKKKILLFHSKNKKNQNKQGNIKNINNMNSINYDHRNNRRLSQFINHIQKSKRKINYIS